MHILHLECSGIVSSFHRRRSFVYLPGTDSELAGGKDELLSTKGVNSLDSFRFIYCLPMLARFVYITSFDSNRRFQCCSAYPHKHSAGTCMTLCWILYYIVGSVSVILTANSLFTSVLQVWSFAILIWGYLG